MNVAKMSDQGVAWLKTVETLSLAVYDDQTGRPTATWVPGATIGYGHLVTSAQWPLYCHGICGAQADALFAQDLSPFEDLVARSARPGLQPNQFDALTILAYNIGSTAFSRSSVLKLVNDPAAPVAYPSLEAAWKAWDTSQGKVMAGLVRRRAAEWQIYSEGVYAHW